MPCALYHMLFAVVKGGKTLFGDAQIRSRGSMPFFLSFRSEKIKGMLLAAHSLDSRNSLYKALAVAHGHLRQSRSISRRIARLTRLSCREGRSRFQWIQQMLPPRSIRWLQWHSDFVVIQAAYLESHILCWRSKEIFLLDARPCLAFFDTKDLGCLVFQELCWSFPFGSFYLKKDTYRSESF